jgi:hypothetical protein
MLSAPHPCSPAMAVGVKLMNLAAHAVFASCQWHCLPDLPQDRVSVAVERDKESAWASAPLSHPHVSCSIMGKPALAAAAGVGARYRDAARWRDERLGAALQLLQHTGDDAVLERQEIGHKGLAHPADDKAIKNIDRKTERQRTDCR